ncbi:helix-turn-helix domain-containing protein [Sinorhizobium meliloti]|uniref:helix-turn-helix domain-containing protein n=1 Tax=Rhizobium meliloti TaxID=382 RepID=UPI003094B36C
MHHNLEIPLTVEEISKRLGVSKRSIERRVRAKLATSPQALYTQIRLDHACHLLSRSDHSIAAIALECGFCDSSHLTRVFRGRYYVTPQKFRLQFVPSQD